MKDSNTAQTDLASALRAAGVRAATGTDDDTAEPAAGSPEGLHGSLRDALAAARAALPQAYALSSLESVETGSLKPIALADVGDAGDGWGSTRPTLFQPEAGEGPTFVAETKPWKVEPGSDVLGSASGAPVAGTDLAAVLRAGAMAPVGGGGGGSALTDALQEATRMVGGTGALEGGVQQLVQAMAGFAPQAAGEALTVSSAFQDALGAVVANPLA
ncbi:hypothetical protein M5C97_24650 [Acidovorax sp. NCPPB 3859]|nr:MULTISPECIES: hypothetical protein [unclassified Acidovorax]MDA8459801.1 hypothetical protein [Acidovorax sp. GBBC 3333]MDA8469704.1 hypothetical protein [Acidovorax sp. GBBC 3299]WCM78632.1 hypothetical protein M5C94_24600 [Acidovorax sp. GBBC 712]WCM83526.1 hypothetical protein M5C97_24650 [Acidovorax sp. NCPPB 3859]